MEKRSTRRKKTAREGGSEELISVDLADAKWSSRPPTRTTMCTWTDSQTEAQRPPSLDGDGCGSCRPNYSFEKPVSTAVEGTCKEKKRMKQKGDGDGQRKRLQSWERGRQTTQTSSKQGGCANNIVLHFGHMLTLYEQPVVIPPDATVTLYLPVKDA